MDSSASGQHTIDSAAASLRDVWRARAQQEHSPGGFQAHAREARCDGIRWILGFMKEFTFTFYPSR